MGYSFFLPVTSYPSPTVTPVDHRPLSLSPLVRIYSAILLLMLPQPSCGPRFGHQAIRPSSLSLPLCRLLLLRPTPAPRMYLVSIYLIVPPDSKRPVNFVFKHVVSLKSCVEVSSLMPAHRSDRPADAHQSSGHRAGPQHDPHHRTRFYHPAHHFIQPHPPSAPSAPGTHLGWVASSLYAPPFRLMLGTSSQECQPPSTFSIIKLRLSPHLCQCTSASRTSLNRQAIIIFVRIPMLRSVGRFFSFAHHCFVHTQPLQSTPMIMQPLHPSFRQPPRPIQPLP